MNLVALPDTPQVERLRPVAPGISALYFGAPVYLVGGALTDPDPRDIDVVVIVPDELFVLAYGDREAWQQAPGIDHETRITGVIAQHSCDGDSATPGPLWRRWARDCAKWNARLTRSCHRRVDFKVQAEWLAARNFAEMPRARLDTPL